MMPLFRMADAFTVVHILKNAGYSSKMAQDWFGIYSRGFLLVLATTVFSTALALSLVPKIAESNQIRDFNEVSHSSYIVLKISIILGLPAGLGMALIRPEINSLFYGNELGNMAMAILGMSSFWLTLAMTSAAILQGMGTIYLPAIFLLIAFVIKVIFNLLGVPFYFVNGAA